MINNLSAYQGTPPADEKSDRKINNGGVPIYAVQDLIAAASVMIIRQTDRCAQDLIKMDILTDIALRDFVLRGLEDGKFRNSEWCRNSKGCWVACDVYVLTQMEWSDTLQKNMPWKYYIKLGLNKSGKAILLISCHPS